MKFFKLIFINKSIFRGMPEVIVIILDNSISMCNQDYFPNRYVLQIETLRKLIDNKYSSSQLNEISIIPLAQPTPHFIATPTKNLSFLEYFISKIPLNRNLDLKSTFFLASKALDSKENKYGTLVFCMGTLLPPDMVDEQIMSAVERIKTMLDKEVLVKIIFLAEAKEYKELFDVQLEHPNYSSVYISPEDDFGAIVADITEQDDWEENDPELAMAIKLSLEETNKKQDN
ncbi:26S proteasome regulatory subunit S5A [Spraguea lophii 42_110]|uniref:26S proteasome regulatory subunit S5A n=1 Tax=Spraguea lophii (strain 42_110) TaxID=1358809 RepID=S7W5A2_SPRLO|nr:26S proteasome regulatory subunit S5A [Spraguea lophii 42_110]